VTVSACNLNQHAMDFDGNLERIRSSIREAKAAGARYRVGPELEVTGYGCEDHFLEQDTIMHSWQSLAALLRDDTTHGIICDVGVPVMYKDCRFNCRVFCLDGKILLIRPKLFLADDGNYRESRYFTVWRTEKALESYTLPQEIQRVTGQKAVPFGVAALDCQDSTMASETCEELFTPRAPHIDLALDGVEIISNGSGSHHQLRKLTQRLELLKSATAKSGGIYIYSNQQGCDGGRLYFDGCAMIALNGEIVAQGSQFSLQDVEVVTATIDVDSVRNYRAAIASRSRQASNTPAVPRIEVDFALGGEAEDSGASDSSGKRKRGGAATQRRISRAIEPRIHPVEEEIALGPAAWLWDYLRRSGGTPVIY